MSDQADDKAHKLVELLRCAKINMDNAMRMHPAVFAAFPIIRIAKHQLDCAAAIADGEPEPEMSREIPL